MSAQRRRRRRKTRGAQPTHEGEPPAPPGGTGGASGIQPRRMGRAERIQQSGAIRRRRLERLVAQASLRHGAAVEESLEYLRELLRSATEPGPNGMQVPIQSREKRQAAEAILRHYQALTRETASSSASSASVAVIGAAFPREAYRAALGDPETRQAAMTLLQVLTVQTLPEGWSLPGE